MIDSPLLWTTFEQAARSHPDRPAFVDGPASVCYSELHERAVAYGARLPGAGLVAVPASDPVETLAWMFGALGAGATVVAIAPEGPDRDAQLRCLRPDVLVTGAGEYEQFERDDGPARSLPPGVIVCTAGTTGDPKAVVHSHATLGQAVRRLQCFRLESAGTTARVPADEHELAEDLLDAAAAPALGLRYAATVPLTTMAGLTVALQALLAGECLLLPSPSEPDRLLATIATSGVTNVSLTPLLARLLLRAARQPSAPRPDALLFVGIGGGPVAPELAEQLERAIGCVVAIGYGMTEAGGALTMGRISDPPAVRHRTAGRALPGVELVLDPLTQELSVHCPSIAIGYLSEVGGLTPLDRDPWATGDLACVGPDSAIVLCGRADSLILRAGRNIDPVRIERALEAHPAVARAAAFGVVNPVVAGEQDVWSVVVLEHTVDESELRTHCNRMLGASLTPRRVIPVDALPLTADGAVRRRGLAQLLCHSTANTRPT